MLLRSINAPIRYAEVQQVQIVYILQNPSYSLLELQWWIDPLASGSSPHSAGVLAALLKRLLDDSKLLPRGLFGR